MLSLVTMMMATASLTSATAIPSPSQPTIQNPTLYNTTNETAEFGISELGFSSPYPQFPGVYKDLDYKNMKTFTANSYHYEFSTVGVYPQNLGDEQGGATFHISNSSSKGTLSTKYPNSTIDHFQMFSFEAGCNGFSHAPAGQNETGFPYPVNCTIHAHGYNSKLDPLGSTTSGIGPGIPSAITSFKYRPVLQSSISFPNGTAAMQIFQFPGSFKFLDTIVLSATLDNVPQGVNFAEENGIDVLITQLEYSVSKLKKAY